jgi:hypothetical protein
MATEINVNNNTLSDNEGLLKKCYATFGVDNLEEGNAKSISYFREAFDKKCDEFAADENYEDIIEPKLKAALQKIEEEKSYAKRAAHFFLNLTPSQQRWTILLTALWISFAMLCVFFGIAIKVDCDNECRREERCHRHLPHNETTEDCYKLCSLDNWSKSLFGVFLLDALLGVVCLGIFIITFAEATNLCGENRCNHQHTFKMPARIAIFTACACCLLGSLFGTLKVSAETGGIGPRFLVDWKWQYCYAFGYVAYAIIWGAYLLDLWVNEFSKSADRNALPPSLRYFGGIVGFVSSVMPLIFFIVVGINVDRPYNDKLDGFKLVAPLLTFFALRCISALIVPFSNCVYHKWEHEAETIKNKALTMICLYLCGILGFIFSALTVNEDDVGCADKRTWKWIYALVPLDVFTIAMMVWSFGLMILLCVNEETGIRWYNKTTIAVVDLLQHQQVSDGIDNSGRTPSNSAPNLNNNNNNNNNNNSPRRSAAVGGSFNTSTPLMEKKENNSSSSYQQQNSQNQLKYQAVDDAEQI